MNNTGLDLVRQLSLIATFGGIVLGIFVVAVLNSRHLKSRANVALSILLISLSFSIAHILFAGVVLNHFSARVYSIGDPTFYLIAPLLWFYTLEVTGTNVSFSWRLILHFLPFLVVILFSVTAQSVESKAVQEWLQAHHRAITIFFWVTLVVQLSGYLLLVRSRWKTYDGFVQEEVSSREGVDISWIRFYIVVFLGINLLFLFSLFAVIHLESGAWLYRTTALVLSVSIFALGYKGILQKQIPASPSLLHEVSSTSLSPVKSEPDRELLKKVHGHMIERRPYLNPELTLSSLAKELDINRSQLSQLINQGTGDNFYDFINKYRVEEVKRLMTDPLVKNYSLLGIALEAGFKSKSTFNLIFKRFTGLTPSEYRKNLLS